MLLVIALSNKYNLFGINTVPWSALKIVEDKYFNSDICIPICLYICSIYIIKQQGLSVKISITESIDFSISVLYLRHYYIALLIDHRINFILIEKPSFKPRSKIRKIMLFLAFNCCLFFYIFPDVTSEVYKKKIKI